MRSVLPSSLLTDSERSLLDLRLLDLGGGDLERDGERDEVLGTETERVGDLFRLRAATPASGEGDLEEKLLASEMLLVERSREGMFPVLALQSSRR